jgi:hypothetical protein
MVKRLTKPIQQALACSRIPVIIVGASALVLAACQNAGTGPGADRSALNVLPNNVAKVATNPGYTFTAYNVGSQNTQVTAIDNSKNAIRIVGVYYGATPAPFKSFIAAAVSSGSGSFGPPSTEPPNSPSNVYLSAINDNRNSNNSYSVGLAPPPASGSGCTGQVCGLIYQPNKSPSLSYLQDPHEGSGSCAQTFLYGTSDPFIQVGYYTTGSGGNCNAHAVEEYNYPSGPQFVEFQFPGTWNVSSSMAYGINNKGDIVGAFTTGTTALGWEYRNFTYSLVQISTFSTQALGVNWADDIVGSYQDSGGLSHGFLQSGSTQYYPIDDGPNGTVINEINNFGTIVGWHNAGGTHHYFDGFIGTCSSCPSIGTDLTRNGHATSTRGNGPVGPSRR